MREQELNSNMCIKVRVIPTLKYINDIAAARPQCASTRLALLAVSANVCARVAVRMIYYIFTYGVRAFGPLRAHGINLIFMRPHKIRAKPVGIICK